MKPIYKLLIINLLIIIMIIFSLNQNKKWYRGNLIFFVSMNKQSIPNIKSPDFLLEKTYHRLVNALLNSKELEKNFLKQVGCDKEKNKCDLLIFWKKRKINLYMQFISNNRELVKKAVNLFPEVAKNFLNTKNREILMSQAMNLQQVEDDLYKDILKKDQQLKDLYKNIGTLKESKKLLSEYFNYIERYMKLRLEKYEKEAIFHPSNINIKNLSKKEYILKRKIYTLEKTLSNNIDNSLKASLLEKERQILFDKYIHEYKRIVFIKTLAEKGNIYYLDIIDSIEPLGQEKPKIKFIIVWLIMFNIFLILFYILIKNVHKIRDKDDCCKC